MKALRAPWVLAVLAVTLGAAVGTAHAASATRAPLFGPRKAPGLDPFRPLPPSPALVSQAEPAPPPEPAATPPASTPAGESKAPIACTRDDQCPAGTICEQGTCRPFERTINILLFRKEGGYTAFMPFYFSQRGKSGYRLIPPFYWHFWSPQDKSRIVFPFYWRFEDYLKQRVVTVIALYSHTKQPDAESWALWPVFYASTKFGWAAPLLLSFKIGDPDRGKSFGLLGLLYFWKRNTHAGTGFDLLFPLFVSSRSPDSAFTFALPLNFYWRTKQDKNLLVVPLFYWNGHPNGGTFASLLGYKSSNGQNSTGSLLWLYWFGRTGPDRHDVGFPLLWSFRGAESSTTLALPLFLHLRRGSWSLTAAPLIPIAWSARDEEKGTAWKLLVPLFFWKTSEHGNSATLITPVGGYTRDNDAGTSAATFLLYFRKRDPQRELDVLFPIYWRYKDVPGDATTRIYGPLYLRDDPAGSTSVLFPVFWLFRDSASGATAHSFFPLYFRRNNPNETTTAAGVFPLWFYYRRFADQNPGWSAGFFPLAFFGQRGDRRHAMVLPLFFHFKDQRESTTVALPLFYHFADRHRSSTGVLPLLYFQGHDHQTGYRVQFPLYWRFTDATAGTATTVVPPFYYQTRKTGWSAGLAPLLFASGGGPRSHFVLFPLYWHFRDDTADRSTTVVLNYLHRREGGQVTDALFPLLHFRRGARTGGTDETSFTLLPLVHYRRDAGSTVFVSPLAAWGRGSERKGGFVLPYFWYQSRTTAASGVPPFYVDFTHLDTGERTRMFGPWVQVDAPGRYARILFPLFGRYKDPQDSGTYVFPTFFHRRTTDGYALDTLAPLFWHSTWPGHATTVIGPWFRTHAPDSSATGLIPLYFYAQNTRRSLMVLTPLFIHHVNRQENTSHTSAALLFYQATNRYGARTVLFPFWWANDQGPAHHRVLFPVFWHFSNSAEASASTLAGPLYWSSHGTHRMRGLLPLAWYSRDTAKGSGSNAVMPLFYERHGNNAQMFLTLPFGYRNAIDRHWWYAGPVFYRDTPVSSFSMVFPLWFNHFNKGSETQTRIIPPLLHFSRTSPDRLLSGWLGLFWRQRSLTSSTTLVLPLFYDVHSFHESRTTLLFPLFLRHRNDSEDTTYSMAPFFYRRSSPGDSTTVAFPLIWDFKGNERRTTVVFPLFAHFRRPTWTATFIIPNIYYRSGHGADEGLSRFFVFPLWESAVKRKGDYMWEILLGFLGYERIGRNRLMKLFFIPIELEPTPAAQTAWYGRQAPRARTYRAQGVNTRVW